MTTPSTSALAGRTALVTGGATLVGHGIVEALHDLGAVVVVVDIDRDGAQQIAGRLGDRVEIEQVDVTDDQAVATLVNGVVERHGSLDILINLACTYLDEGAATSRADWLTALNVNLVSAVRLAEVARPFLASSGHGAIINFTSISSSVAQTGRWVYPASKAAKIGRAHV